MKQIVHLVSMPWQNHNVPSIQLGTLKAHVDAKFRGLPHVHVYSAHLAIPEIIYRQSGSHDLHQFSEYPYQLLCLREAANSTHSLSGAWHRLFAAVRRTRQTARALNAKDLNRLAKATRVFLDRELIRNLKSDALNLVGFSMNFDQVYASVFAANYILRRRPACRVLFLFGGSSAAYPHVANVLKKFGIKGLGVLGEGERKLESIVSIIARTDAASGVDEIISQLKIQIPGTYDLADPDVNFMALKTDYLKTQFENLAQIPLPDYGEYYRRWKKATIPDIDGKSLRETQNLMMEGTRGCFAKCDFCNLNTSWEGFRKLDARRILENAQTLIDRYGIPKIFFVDNVCDTWAEEFCDALIQSKSRIPMFMELRAHHPQRFWTKLALAGVVDIQVGIEALSSNLLRTMKKGTWAFQNVLVQKWLKELGIASSSNLITYHPKSTIEDVRATRALLEKIPHLGRFRLSKFVLGWASPLHGELSYKEKTDLETYQWGRFPVLLREYLIPQFEFVTPPHWREQSLSRAWERFTIWYGKHIESRPANPSLDVIRLHSGRLVIEDRRSEAESTYELDAAESAVYDLCHQGPTRDALVRRSGLGEGFVAKILRDLAGENLLVEIDGRLIALALRNRDELVMEFLNDGRPLKNETESREAFSETVPVCGNGASLTV